MFTYSLTVRYLWWYVTTRSVNNTRINKIGNFCVINNVSITLYILSYPNRLIKFHWKWVLLWDLICSIRNTCWWLQRLFQLNILLFITQETSEKSVMPEDPAKDHNFREPIIDSLRVQKDDVSMPLSHSLSLSCGDAAQCGPWPPHSQGF